MVTEFPAFYIIHFDTFLLLSLTEIFFLIKEISKELNNLLASFGDTNDFTIVQDTLNDRQQKLKKDVVLTEVLEKLEATSMIKGSNSFNYGLVVKDKVGIHSKDLEKGRIFLLYWGKGLKERVLEHFHIAAFVNHLNKEYSGKIGRPNLLYEALSYFLEFPDYYEVGFFKFFEGSTDVEVQKLEAALIEMRFRAADIFNGIQLLNQKRELQKSIRKLSDDELLIVMCYSHSSPKGFRGAEIEYRSQAKMEKEATHQLALKVFESFDAQIKSMKGDEKLPFNFILGKFHANVFRRTKNHFPPGPIYLSLLMLKRERENGGKTFIGGRTFKDFFQPFYAKVGFKRSNYKDDPVSYW